MSTITELVAPPEFIHQRIAQFEQQFSAFASTLPLGHPLRVRLAPLAKEMGSILAALKVPNLSAAETSGIVERWDSWTETFNDISDPAFDEELEHLFIALPS
ncbi:MAG TPA: hypothetical protein VNA69_11700 [Thermoanaerobaculia bacterium]|nr:hypothetical protein [Thermoanaerobaculia bacterium]